MGGGRIRVSLLRLPVIAQAEQVVDAAPEVLGQLDRSLDRREGLGLIGGVVAEPVAELSSDLLLLKAEALPLLFDTRGSLSTSLV